MQSVGSTLVLCNNTTSVRESVVSTHLILI